MRKVCVCGHSSQYHFVSDRGHECTGLIDVSRGVGAKDNFCPCKEFKEKVVVDKTTRDYQDVLIIVQMIKEGKSRDAIRFECSVLSHLKFPYSHSKKGHELRQKYRKWLRITAQKEAKHK